MLQKNLDIIDLLIDAVSEGVIVVDELKRIISTNALAKIMFMQNKDDDDDDNQHFSILIPKKDPTSHEDNGLIDLVRDFFDTYKNGNIFPKVVDQTKKIWESLDQLKIISPNLVVEKPKQGKAESKIKTAFLSLVSHEFKTHLSGILTSAMLLSKYKLDQQQENRDKHIKIITGKVHFLNNLLTDFLSVEKLETGKVTYRFRSFKLNKVVDSVVYHANMLLKDGQKIDCPENIDNISMFQDEKIVELTLSNLVHNAIKYSQEDSIINIEVTQKSNITIFKISDKGIGIPINDQKNIFNRYFRAENALHIQGTGIGLNIVKNHLENLGGSISFKSKENIGTTFTVTIPNKTNNETHTIN